MPPKKKEVAKKAEVEVLTVDGIPVVPPHEFHPFARAIIDIDLKNRMNNKEWGLRKEEAERTYYQCPAKYITVYDFLTKAEEYFNAPIKKKKNGKPKHLTLSGLCLHLGISRHTIKWMLDGRPRENHPDPYYYKDPNKPDLWQMCAEYCYSRLENYAEENLFAGSFTPGVIFILKNRFKWVDKQNVELGNEAGKPLELCLSAALQEHLNAIPE